MQLNKKLSSGATTFLFQSSQKNSLSPIKTATITFLVTPAQYYYLKYFNSCYLLFTQHCSFNTRLVDAGLFFNAAIGLIGRLTKLPPQLGH